MCIRNVVCGWTAGLFVGALTPGMTLAAPIVDGTRTFDNYGPARAVQTVETQFGDNFSELDAAYAVVEEGKLFLMLTGNLEANFNKLNIFIDSTPGGQNAIDGANNPNNDNWAQRHDGMSFSSGFNADYMLILRHGNGGTQFDVDWAKVGGAAEDGGLVGSFDGTAATGTFSTDINGQVIDMQVAIDNSNVAGILGGTAAADQDAALEVASGIELSIDLDDIGNPTGPFRISAMINGSNHDFLSNQFLGGLPPGTGNLGGDGAGNFTGSLGGINLNNFALDQFFVVVPEPATMGLLSLGIGGLWMRRRVTAPTHPLRHGGAGAGGL